VRQERGQHIGLQGMAHHVGFHVIAQRRAGDVDFLDAVLHLRYGEVSGGAHSHGQQQAEDAQRKEAGSNRPRMGDVL